MDVAQLMAAKLVHTTASKVKNPDGSVFSKTHTASLTSCWLLSGMQAGMSFFLRPSKQNHVTTLTWGEVGR